MDENAKKRLEGYKKRATEILKAVEKAGRNDLTKEENAEFDELMNSIEFLSKSEGNNSAKTEIIALKQGLYDQPGRSRGDNVKTGEVRLYKAGEDLREGRSFNLPSGTEAKQYSVGRYLRSLATGQWESPEKELRDLYQNSDTAGGYIVPEVLSRELITAANNQMAVMKAGARSFDMTAETVSMARVDSMPTSSWVSENQALEEDSSMSFGKLTMVERTCGCIVKISEDLLRNGQNASSVLQSAMSESLALKQDYGALFGLGAANEPQGLYYIKTADGMNEDDQAGPLTGCDNLLDLWADLLADNCPDEGLSMIVNSKNYVTMSKWKSGQGEYLSAIGGLPEPIQKMKRFVSNQIPTTLGASANASAIFMGKFENLLIGNRVSGFQVKIGGGLDEFKKRQVYYRLTWTGDILCIRPSWFGRLIGITG